MTMAFAILPAVINASYAIVTFAVASTIFVRILVIMPNGAIIAKTMTIAIAIRRTITIAIGIMAIKTLVTLTPTCSFAVIAAFILVTVAFAAIVGKTILRFSVAILAEMTMAKTASAVSVATLAGIVVFI